MRIARVGKTIVRDDVKVGARCRCAAAREHDAPGAVEGEARGGVELAGIRDADADFGADQANLVCVHAAEHGNVDGDGRYVTETGDDRDAGRQADGGGVDLVATCDDVEMLRPETGVDLHGAGEEVDLIQGTGVKAGTANRHRAACDAKGSEAAEAAEDRRAGGERQTAGVDEAAAVAGDAVGVGDDEFGARSGDFGGAGEEALVGRGDFVEDELRGRAGQVGVAGDEAGQLGVHQHGAVVEDEAGTADVVVGVLVVRDAGCVGGGDLDDGDAVAGGVDRRALACGGSSSGGELGLR